MKSCDKLFPDSTYVRRLLASCVLATLCSMPPAQATEAVRLIRSADGVPLCIFETGNPAGPPIVLIHGFSQSYAVFKLQFQSNLGRDYRLLAYDLRGHGCSGKPWDASYYTTKRIAGDLVATLAHFKLERPLLVGWSYGGFVIMDYIRHFGDRHIAGVMLVGSNAGLPPRPTEPAAIERARVMRESNREASPDIAVNMQNGHNFVRVMTFKPAPPDMAEIMFATNQMLPTYARRAMVDQNLQNDDLIAKLTVPVVLLAGDKDASQPAAVLTAVAGKLAHGRVVLVPDAGHATFIDAPEAFERELREFATATAPR
jgi:non-heme chloroperoxidase